MQMEKTKRNASGSLVVLYAFDSTGAVVQNVILARFLGLQEFGYLAALLSAAMFAFVISDFGTGLSVCRLLASGRDHDIADSFRDLWTTRVWTSVLSVTLFAVAGVLLFPTYWFTACLLMASELFRSLANF